MSAPATPSSSRLAEAAAVAWADPDREAAFHHWLQGVGEAHGLVPASLRPASADASFRRYLRIDGATAAAARAPASFIIMDAPPDKEDCKPFVAVAALMADAGLLVPRVLAWNEAMGFMLLDDLGAHTMIERVDAADPAANLPLYQRAVEALVAWQRASRPGVLPPYDEALLARVVAHLNEKKASLYVKDVFMGADPEFAVPYRFVGEYATHAMFAHNMFPKDLKGVKDVDSRRWTMINAPSFVCVPERDGCRAEAAIVIDVKNRICLVAGRADYCGVVKKTIFTVGNLLAWQAPGYESLIVARILTGLAHGV